MECWKNFLNVKNYTIGICFTEGMKEGLPFLKDLADSSILFFEL